MILGVHQPYLFPYIGYFQLIQAVDTFVFLNDVNYIKGGYINRNKIIINNKPRWFSVPIISQSSNVNINQTNVNPRLFEVWLKKFFKTFEQNYSKCNYYSEIKNIIKEVFESDHSYKIDQIAATSVKRVCSYLNLDTNFFHSSNLDYDRAGEVNNKIISLCKLFNATTYVNATNGKKLYHNTVFENHRIKLGFIQPEATYYSQTSNNFYPNMSILDVLMNCSKEEIKLQLNNYRINFDLSTNLSE